MDDDYAFIKYWEQSILDEIELAGKSEKDEQQVQESKTENVPEPAHYCKSHNIHGSKNEETLPSNSVSVNMDEILEMLYPISYSNQVTSNPSPPKDVTTSAVVVAEQQPSDCEKSQQQNESNFLVNIESETSSTVVEFTDLESLPMEINDQANLGTNLRSTDTEVLKSVSSPGDLVVGQFVCRFCGKRVENLETHEKDQHKDPTSRRWLCVYCEKTYASAQKLKAHYETDHTRNQRTVESQSKANIESAISYTANKSRNGEDSSQSIYNPAYQQAYVPRPKSSDTAALNAAYSLQGFSDRTSKCKLCGRQVSSLTVHLEDHQNSSTQRWMCLHCPKSYASAHGLRYHYDAVHRLNKYACKKCSRKFTYLTAALRHVKQLECDPTSGSFTPDSS